MGCCVGLGNLFITLAVVLFIMEIDLIPELNPGTELISKCFCCLCLFLTNLETLFFNFLFLRQSFNRTNPLQSVGKKKPSQGGSWTEKEEKIEE